MKKILTSMLLIITLVITSMTTALAAGAPSWKSFFTSEKYNKTFTDKDGVHHEYKCYQVVEGWNKVGTVIYQVFYKDTATKQISETEIKIDNTHKSAFFTYKNSCPVFPNAPKHTYYYVNHYRDHDEVIDDYRASLPKTTSTPKATATPKVTAKATIKPTAKVTLKPTAEATPKATSKATPTPVVSLTPVTPTPMTTPDFTPTTSPSATPSVTTTATASPTATEPTAIPSLQISATPTMTPSTTTAQVATTTISPVISAVPTDTDIQVDAAQTQSRPMSTLLIVAIIALLILVGVIYAMLRLRRSWRK